MSAKALQPIHEYGNGAVRYSPCRRRREASKLVVSDHINVRAGLASHHNAVYVRLLEAMTINGDCSSASYRPSVRAHAAH